MEKSPLEKLREMQNIKTHEMRGPVPEKSPQNKSILSIIGVALVFIFTKFGLILSLVLKLKFFLPTLLTMGLSLWIYSKIYGWQFALGFLLLILLHEYGHGLAAKIMGLKVGVPIFIPFFGAVIALKEQPRSTFVEAVVGFGGPFAGLIGATGVFFYGFYSENPGTKDFFIALAWVTAMINYFNLMPFFGLDGDRISQPLRTNHWVVLVIAVCVLIYWYHEETHQLHPFMLILILGAIIKGFRVWHKSKPVRQESLLDKLKNTHVYPEEANISDAQRLQSLIAYLFLASALTYLMIHSEILRVKPPA
jgi:Zn-dependent protease